jgi:site-specific recombinase XerD
MRTRVRVIQGRLAETEPYRTSAIEAAYQHFRLDKQGSLVSPKTLQHYEWTIRPFLRWLNEEHPEVLRFEQLNVEMVRQYRVDMSQRLTTRGRLPEPATLNDLHRLLMTFLRWAEDEGYAVDSRMRRLKAPRVPLKEATVLHIAQLRDVLAACNPERPQEELIVRMLVGSGVRAAELCGLAVRGPDGLPDLMLDSLDRGRVELRVRWDAGAKGKKSRRVPITPKLAAVIKRYEARHRDHARVPNILVNDRGLSYTSWGIDQLMDRLEKRVGFHIHAHAFRHTFATVACQAGWNLERLRAAMGHADYAVLHRYVRLSSERDLGSLLDWSSFITVEESALPAMARGGRSWGRM